MASKLSMAIVCCALVAACGPSKPAQPPKTPKTPPTKALKPKPAGKRAAAPSAVGGSCRAKQPFAQGNCQAGLRCLPFPGGYCFTFCAPDGKCPSGGRCAPSPKAGEWCWAACKRDAECRAKLGYRCHPDWKVCSLPKFLVPKLRQCTAEAPPRRTFAKAVAQQLTRSKEAGFYQHEPAVALGKDGSLTIAYINAAERLGGKNALGLARIGPDGKTVANAAHAASFGRENHFDPWLAASRDGTLHLVWLGFDGGRAPEKNMQIGYARSSDNGATFKLVGAAHDAAADCTKNRVGCMDKPMIISGVYKKNRRKRALYAFYYSAVTDGLRVTRSLDGGKSWSRSVAAGAGAYGSALVDRRGIVHVVYADARRAKVRIDRLGDANTGVFYVRSDDGGATFSKPQLASAPSDPVPFFFSNPQVVVARDGKTIHVVYPTGLGDGRWDIALTTSRDGGKTFPAKLRVKVNDDASCANHRVPQAVVDRRGRIHIAWYEDRDGKGNVAYARCRDGSRGRAVRCGKSERINDAPFAAYSLVRHSPRWIGEYFGLVLDEKRRRIHAVWTQPVLDRGVASARIFHAMAPLR
ncbi:MAG: exo-alpha-sialidase [Myxococcales bacterium]|nr:exo-alpha-sialidase [Myxococcales bacterium]